MTMTKYPTAPFQGTVPVSGVPYEVPVDTINHPPHYKVGGIETIDYMKAKSIKYLSRTGYKGDALEDLKKAQWYLNKLIEECESANN